MNIKHVILMGLVVSILLCLCTCIQQCQSEPPAETVPETTEVTVETTAPPPTEPPTALEIITAFAEENGLTIEDYPEPLIKLLDRNPETESFVLNYPLEASYVHQVDLWEYALGDDVPLFMQWDRRWGYMDYGGEPAGLSACGPVSLSMVVCYLTRDYSYSPDYMIQYALDNGYCSPGNGSYWSLIDGAGKAHGLEVFSFPPEKDRILSNLRAGNPIICLMGPGDFTSAGHFIVMTGLENDLIRINDSNSYANSRTLWEYDSIGDQITCLWVFRNP